MRLNLSQPKTHFVLSPAASPCPAVSSGHTALPQHLIIGAGWKDPAVEGLLLQVTYGSAEGPTCWALSDYRLSHERLPSGSAALRQHPPFSCPAFCFHVALVQSALCSLSRSVQQQQSRRLENSTYIYSECRLNGSKLCLQNLTSLSLPRSHFTPFIFDKSNFRCPFKRKRNDPFTSERVGQSHE